MRALRQRWSVVALSETGKVAQKEHSGLQQVVLRVVFMNDWCEERYGWFVKEREEKKTKQKKNNTHTYTDTHAHTKKTHSPSKATEKRTGTTCVRWRHADAGLSFASFGAVAVWSCLVK